MPVNGTSVSIVWLDLARSFPRLADEVTANSLGLYSVRFSLGFLRFSPCDDGTGDSHDEKQDRSVKKAPI